MKRMTWRYRIFMYLANVLVICFLILPLVPVVLGALQSERTLHADVWALLPSEYTLDNFRLILSGGENKGKSFQGIDYLPNSVTWFRNAFLNSMVVATSVTVLTLSLATLTALTVTRLRLSWTTYLMNLTVISRMVPLIVLMLPLFVVMRNIGLLNTLPGIIIAEVGLLLPYAIIILVPYFQAFPKELEESARLDGCSRFGAYVRIVVPLSTPALAACGVIIFIISWHELLIPLIIASKPEFMTLPVVLAGLVSDQFVFFTVMMAICLIGLAPTLALVLLLQKYLVKGLTAGAVKG
ncbi:MAG: carbohydrate ABC transporter permease [Sulfitobacter sp.]|uniref:carbohydrate ABC transporter permease n=1 Tax=Alphaproteobacteria TaxID=28211 RepID=UPI002943F4CE|nr:carbohydrate ABC transporter permease [Sulfitobacter sp. LC.270.F.C4]WOI16670.1 carbohydrate ABC transporter permease [Sulfitobacter sp. LC.270.F.C4]